MPSVGRNDPCPCGSGRKWKRCCGAPDTARPATPPLAALPPQKVTFSFEPTGLPGTETTVLVANVFEDPGDPRNFGNPSGLPGLYRVVFTFSRPGRALHAERQISFEEGLEGDSHLAIAPPAHAPPGHAPGTQLRIECMTPEGRFVCFGIPNSQGFLGKIRFEPFAAKDQDDASDRAFRALASALSSITTFLDVPLHVHQTDVTELRTGNCSVTHVVPFREVPMLALPPEPLQEDFRLYASLYREGMNSDSPAYALLCAFKIIEGARARRDRRAAEQRQRGERPTSSPRITIPRTRPEQVAWLRQLFPVGYKWDALTLDSIFLPEVLGRRAEAVVMDELRQLRLKIAHALLDSGEPGIQLDGGQDRQEIRRWLPLARCLARAYMRTEFPRMFPTASA